MPLFGTVRRKRRHCRTCRRKVMAELTTVEVSVFKGLWLHAILCVLTLGLWLFPYLLMLMVRTLFGQEQWICPKCQSRC